MPSKIESSQLFDQWAPTYNEDLKNPTGPLWGYQDSLQQAAELLRHKKPTDVLDIGIGTGAFADIFHKRGPNPWYRSFQGNAEGVSKGASIL